MQGDRREPSVADILVPKLNANDNAYVLLQWLAGDGDPVTTGAPLVEIETSKAVAEIAAPTDGFLRHAAAAGAEVAPGQVIASVAATPLPPAAPATVTATATADTTAADTDTVEPGDSQLITAPARLRMTELGVTEEQVRRLAVKVVRSADIVALASGPAPVRPEASVHTLSKVQRAVGRAVSRSHATIPAAYSVTKIDVGAALARAKDLIRQVRQPVGLANLFIEAVAGLHARFPLFYGELDDDGATVRLAEAPHIGVTVDVGLGLYVPVIRDAATRTAADIARRLSEIRDQAARGTFRASDLDGANIAITLHTEADVVLAIPFIFPGQVCALAITTPQPEVVLTSTGSVSSRTVAHIGLAYDHRVINGRDAALYLEALKQALR
jgi:2-oxoglutarate dehydrogenase E2 component (dihydrolipoamide succinyltransferase)